MININELKELVEFIANKHQSGASMSPNEYNIAVQSSLDDVIMYYYGLPQKYALAAPMPPVAFEVTQLVTDYLSTLKHKASLAVDTTGRAILPADYFHVSFITYKYVTGTTSGNTSTTQDTDCETASTATTTIAQNNQPALNVKNVPVLIIDDAKWDTLLTSTIRKPTKRYPACNFQSGYIQCSPTDLGMVEMTYLRLPLKPIWNYTTPNGVDPQYDVATSVDVELPSTLKNQMAYLVLTKLGINVREGQLQQYAELMKAHGQ